MLSMRTRLSLTTRLLSLISILLFAGMGVGFSMLDAVRFHGRGEHLNGRAHYEQAGGCRDHAENCLLVFSSSTDRAVPPPPPVTHFVAPVAAIRLLAINSAVSHPVLRATTTRAPPSLLS